MMRYLKRFFRKFKATTFVVILLHITLPLQVFAAIQGAQPTPKVSFTFDDGYKSVWQHAAPVLGKYGFTGTSYVTTGFVGQENHMTWNQIKRLQNERGWDIGSHTVTHPLLTQVSASQLNQELNKSKNMLTSRGINVRSFATPYGDYNNQVLAAAAKYYETHRPFHDQGHNHWPYSDYLLQVRQVQRDISVAQVKQYVDEAKQNNTWLILVFHDIKNLPSTELGVYDYARKDLNAVAKYVADQGLSVTNVANGVVSSDSNLISDGDFVTGMGSWRTDASTNVRFLAQNRGAMPFTNGVVRMTAASDRNVHLFAPQASVTYGATYLYKSFLNVETIQGGAVGYYIDEYDQLGNWISGQYKIEERSSFVENLNFTYQPSSAAVTNASLQVIVTANSGIVAYVDSFRMYHVR